MQRAQRLEAFQFLLRPKLLSGFLAFFRGLVRALLLFQRHQIPPGWSKPHPELYRGCFGFTDRIRTRKSGFPSPRLGGQGASSHPRMGGRIQERPRAAFQPCCPEARTGFPTLAQRPQVSRPFSLVNRASSHRQNKKSMASSSRREPELRVGLPTALSLARGGPFASRAANPFPGNGPRRARGERMCCNRSRAWLFCQRR